MKCVVVRIILAAIVLVAGSYPPAAAQQRLTLPPIEIEIDRLAQELARVTVHYQNVEFLNPRTRVYFLTVEYFALGRRPVRLATKTTKIEFLSSLKIEVDFKLGLAAQGTHLILATMTDITRPGAPVLNYLLLPFDPSAGDAEGVNK